MAVANDMQQPSGTYNDSTTEAQIYQMLVASGGNTSAAARIAQEVNSGQRSMDNVEYWLAQSGGGGGGYTSSPSSVTSTTSGGGGAYTEADVAALFNRYGVPINSPTETERQRLQRITFQLNSGARTIQDVEYYVKQTAAEIAAGTHWSVTGDTSGFGQGVAPMYGGAGASELQNITGGNGELWYDSDAGVHYLVYFVPGTDVPLLYAASPDQINALFPQGQVRADRTVTTGLIAQMGGIYAGSAQDPFGDPYRAFIEQLEREAGIRPWLNDPDMLAIMFEAALEGRQVSQAELMGTEWWRTHNEGQRTWMTLVESDPMTAAQMMESAKLDTRTMLEAMGMSTPPDDIVNWMASQRITGEWSDSYYQSQLRAISDPQSGIEVDSQLRSMIGGRTLDTIMVNEEKVRQTVSQWLGPLYGDWSDSQIAYWAGRLRNDPDGQEELVNVLRGQRSALFPEYENDMLTYEDIAAPWRNMWENTWGQMADETDPLFQQVLRMNDYNEAGKLLRSEGLARNVGQVAQSLEKASLSAGGQLRRSF